MGDSRGANRVLAGRHKVRIPLGRPWHNGRVILKWILRCVIPVVCRKTNGEVNISHENTTIVVRIYDGF